MGIPAFPNRDYDDTLGRSFTKIIGCLRCQLEKRLVPNQPGTDQDKKFFLSREVETLFEVWESSIKELCVLTVKGRLIRSSVSTTRCVEDKFGPVAPMLDHRNANAQGLGAYHAQAEQFWQGIMGRDIAISNPGDARMYLLAVLIICNVTIDSAAWHNFFHRTISAPGPGEERFCDRLLPLRNKEHVQAVFGHDPELNVSIFANQSLACVRVINESCITIGTEEASLWRMPYIEEELIGSHTDGGDSNVYRVRLDTDRCFLRSNKGVLIRKDVSPKSPEVDILKRLASNSKRSRHIVKVRAIIHYRDKVSILMEPAEEDLFRLLSEGGHLNGSVFKDKRRIFKKLLGLVDGLLLIHEGITDERSGKKMVGAHLDLRPENILRTKCDKTGDDVFKLADFGMSLLRIGSPQDENLFDPRQGGDCPFRPPESIPDIRFEDQSRNPCAYDVYCIGALFCFCLAWLWDGPAECRRLEDMLFNRPFKASNVKSSTSFFSIFPYKHLGFAERFLDSNVLRLELKTPGPPVNVAIKLDEAVIQYFEGIRNGGGDSEHRHWDRKFIWEIFSILKSRCLHPDPSRRCTMKQLYQALDAAVEKYKDVSSR